MASRSDRLRKGQRTPPPGGRIKLQKKRIAYAHDTGLSGTRALHTLIPCPARDAAFFAALQYCGQRGIRVPQDASLVCLQESAGFAYCAPPVAHCRWDHARVVRRIVRWSDNVARSKDDRRLSISKAESVEGGTIGPVIMGEE